MSTTQPRILAVDATTDACSVALISQGHIDEDFRQIPRAHTRFLLPMIDEMLTSHALTLADLNAIAFAAGPGSFTGLRIVAATIQGLAFSAGVGVIPVSTLQGMAQTWFESQATIAENAAVISTLDARMNELYVGEYRWESSLAVPVVSDRLCRPDALQFSCGRYDAMVGSGCTYRHRFASPDSAEIIDEALQPRAAAIATLAMSQWHSSGVITADQAQPVYLRDSVAWKT